MSGQGWKQGARVLPSAMCAAKPRVAGVLSHHAGPRDPELEWEARMGLLAVGTRFLGHVWTHSPARPARGGPGERPQREGQSCGCQRWASSLPLFGLWLGHC